jgi:hypothetical protein
MKCAPLIIGAVVGATTVMIPQHAKAAGWRCDGADCQESLINDIEDRILAIYPQFLDIPMPRLGYSCSPAGTSSFVSGPGSSFVGGGPKPPTTGTIEWSARLNGVLNWFVLDRHSAAVGISGVLTAGSGVTGGGDVGLAYSIAESTSNVVRGGIDTGVSDLGAIQSLVASGAVWNNNLTFEFSVGVGIQNCLISVGSYTFTVTRGGGRVQVLVPLANIQRDVARAVADAFRTYYETAVFWTATGQ